MNILVVKLASIGDVLVSTPFFRLLKEMEPKSRVGHLVMNQCKFVTQHNLFVDYHISIRAIKLRNLVEFIIASFKIFFRVRAENPDVIILLHNNIFLRFLLKLSLKSKSKLIGFYRTNSIFLSTGLRQSTEINRSIEEYKLFKAAGFDIARPNKIEYFPNKDSIIQTIDLPENFILCNPGGGNVYADAENRSWPIGSYADLIDKSIYPFVIVGNGASDFDKVKKLENKCSKKFINLVGKTSFDQVNDLLSKSMLYIGNDSSIMFLAASCNCKSLILFGPTQVTAALPIGFRGDVIRSAVGCSPCYVPEDGIKGTMYTCEDNICMKEISVKTVIKKIDELCAPQLILENDT